MNRIKAKDPREMRRLIQADGLAYPRRFDEADPPFNICSAGSNVRFNIGLHLNDMDHDVGELQNWTSIGDFCFEDHEFAWRPPRYLYRGDTPRPTKRPLKNFLRTVLHIKMFKSDQELEEEARAIREILARYPQRAVKIYNVNSLLAYLAASPGVTVSPKEIIQYLKVDLLKSKYESYKSSKKYFNKRLKERRAKVEKELDKSQKLNDKICEDITNRIERASLRKKNTWDKIMAKRTLKKALIDGQERFNELMVAYWEFKLMNDDCFHFLFEYLLTHMKDFCKLNPMRQPKR